MVTLSGKSRVACSVGLIKKPNKKKTKEDKVLVAAEVCSLV